MTLRLLSTNVELTNCDVAHTSMEPWSHVMQPIEHTELPAQIDAAEAEMSLQRAMASVASPFSCFTLTIKAWRCCVRMLLEKWGCQSRPSATDGDDSV